MSLCVCGSKKEFSKCCEPFLTGKSKAKTLRQLVRSRYAAYALGGHTKYLIETWHPSTVRNIKSAELNTDKYKWESLEIVSHTQKGDIGQVEFRAKYKDEDGTKIVHHELSIFQRAKGIWYYVDGRELIHGNKK